MKLLDWLDHRTGYRQSLSHALDEPVAGGASFAYVFGSVLTFILLLQMVTGVLLAMYYSPSATDAWASVAYIQDTVTLGWLIRGLHSYGASAMVIVAVLHLLQTAIYGAYKAPRELNWLIGVLLLGLILAFALTGYLLPWDQTGYWATKVATGIAGTSPVIGQELAHAVQGGNEYGNLTLTRFFALHVFVLPALTVLLVVAHLRLFRRHGVTPRWGRSRDELVRRTQPFWPDQMFRDMVAMAAVFAAMVAITVYTRGAHLGPPADPASSFDARPEWYFRPLFQALKYFEGPLEQVVALGLPVVVGGVLVALPFLDRGASTSPRGRAGFLAIVGAGVVLAGALTALSLREDASDSALQERLVEAKKLASVARSLARENGVPAAGGTAVYTTQPWYRSKQLWAEHCAACHQGDERKGPAIGAGYNSREWIAAFLREPNGAPFFGVSDELGDMEPVTAAEDDFRALVEFIYAESGANDADAALVDRGKQLFDDGTCFDCHERDGTSESSPGPNLGGRGSDAWLQAMIRDASQPHLFGERNEMPLFGDELAADDIAALAEYVIFMRSASAEALAPVID